MDFNINVGDMVDIGEIKDEKLSFLSGKMGVVTQVLDSPVRRNRGYIVRVIGIDHEDKEWFVDSTYLSKK